MDRRNFVDLTVATTANSLLSRIAFAHTAPKTKNGYRQRGSTRPSNTVHAIAMRMGAGGGEFRAEFVPAPGEIVAQEHWCSSGFANTDLDLQLKNHGIHQLIIIGLIAHTCVEATVRFAAELGYEVTMVKDATASYSDEEMHAALDVNIPNYASVMVTTEEIVASISAL